jgi:cytochrome d ubiquinol oxidase subunit II
MATAWDLILAFLRGGYVVLDGFDLGVGVLYLWAGHSDDERRKMLAAVGPGVGR